MAKFFIERPVFAWVLAIIMMLCGLLSIANLPVAQYPSIAPPTVSIQVNYPGASAKTVQDTVVQVIEQQMNGLDNLQYISSESNSDGSMSIALTFAQGTDADTAQVQVQNKLALAQPLLPLEVQQQGIRVTKSTANFMMVMAFVSTDGRMTRQDLADYVASYVQDPISRTNGVGDFQLFGAPYAMRIWLDPAALVNYSLTATDVSNAIQEQNVEVSSGQLGGQPALPGQELNATVIGPSRLQTPEEFGQILLKTDPDGSRVRLADVARIELGAQNYAIDSYYNGNAAVGLGVRLATGANALQTAQAVRATLAELKPFFPPGMEAVDAYDTIPFISLSIENVVRTLVEAVVLVFAVMYLFLQNFRATLIPTLAVPVVLLGTFGVLAAFGYSINTLTMFGMVLAIGLLVDDAIVVVENVERLMHEEGLSPKQATRKSMSQITGALIGIAMVLSAVFLPMAFFGGSTGVIYRQFSVTIVASMVLSVILALTLAPALCATLLKPAHDDLTDKGLLGKFNRGYNRLQEKYADKVARVIHSPMRYLLLYGLLLIAAAVMYMRLPTGFLPNEDQGVVMVQYTLPAGATDARTSAVSDAVKDYFLTDEKANVSTIFTINGFGFSGSGQNAGMAFVSLKDWSQRPGNANTADAIAKRAMAHFATIRDAQVFSMSPPAIDGFGQSDGFTFELQAKGATTRAELQVMRDQIIAAAGKNPSLSAVRANTLPDTPQLQVDIDNDKLQALGLSAGDVSSTLTSAFGSTYINDFIDRNRVKKVYMQGDVEYRSKPEDLDKWFVRGTSSSTTSMTPFSAFASSHWIYGPENLSRYNGLSSFEITGEGAPGTSSGTAMDEMEKLASQFSSASSFSWSGLSYQERLTSGQAASLYAISLVVVFLCLAALYESWSIPFAVMMVVPMGVVGSLLAITLRGLENDIYFQVALLTIIGLSAKNAILIVEFAEENYQRGEALIAAAVEASRMRLRPILMTSLAFSAGVLPLAVSSGAGANSRIAIGTGIIGGTITATLLAIFFVPLFYVLVRRMFSRKTTSAKPTENTSPQAGE